MISNFFNLQGSSSRRSSGSSLNLGSASNQNQEIEEQDKNIELFLIAAIGNDIKTMEDLLKQGKIKSVNVKHYNGNTPLQAAALKGNKKAVEFLLDKGADIGEVRKDMREKILKKIEKLINQPQPTQQDIATEDVNTQELDTADIDIQL